MTISTEKLKQLIADHEQTGLPFSGRFTADLAREVVRLRENSEKLQVRRPQNNKTYVCETCGTADRGQYMRCFRPSCPDGRDQ